ncbi:MAG: RsmB/NOP family class I SAM-dependent RNA methyltransferase [Verrucomicrobia bacterium]|nr:RsmB/NOP family class I SAM-dependent RNA methyltransferase [Verrucomicrobiota bacterium]
MPDQTTLNHAAQVLAGLAADQRADTALRHYFEHHPYLRPHARRAISHAVFVYFRWLSWLDSKASPQKRLEQATALHGRFLADEKSVKPEALAARAVPAWVRDEMELPEGYLRQLQRDPALWLRARPAMGGRLAAALGDCEHSQRAPDALRYTGRHDLFHTDQFQNGEFEIQDLASQLVGHACAPRPGETWWDACAGEGGKTLHLCDLMGNKGVVWASDRHTGRLDTLKRRAKRAQLFNYRAAVWDGSAKLPTKTRFDGILLDAPCSGVGTWQRNPHARWTTSPADVAELAATQLALLNHLAGSLKPGGRLIYSVCTLTRSETTAVADAFAAAHPELEPYPLFGAAPAAPEDGDLKTENRTAHPDPSSVLRALSSVFLWPHELNANGMFLAAWSRKK